MSRLLENVSREELAKWVLVGFGRAWCLGEVFDACGVTGVVDYDEASKVHPIIPRYWRRVTPVRAIIAEHLPRLAAALDRGLRSQAEVDAAIKAVCAERKRINKVSGVLDSSEQGVVRRTRQKFRAQELGRQGYADRNNIGATGWKVCK
jgi:hypothetical protein